MTVEAWILQYADSLALLVSIMLWLRVETIRRQINRLDGKICVILTVLGYDRQKNDRRPPVVDS